jgi:hypothetical protein
MPSEVRESIEDAREDESDVQGQLPTEMPLLDAVQTLVDKERQLMELKVAEAAHEAHGNVRKIHASMKLYIAANAD